MAVAYGMIMKLVVNQYVPTLHTGALQSDVLLLECAHCWQTVPDRTVNLTEGTSDQVMTQHLAALGRPVLEGVNNSV